MEITNEIKANIFAQYLGQKINENNSTFYDTMISVDMFNESIHTSNHITYKLNEIKLVLKPLYSITDEDAKEVCKIYGCENGQVIILPHGNELTIIKFQRAEYDSDYFWLSTNQKGNWNILVYQFLINKGYDLPNYLLGGKTLHKSGLAIYEK